jgi:hypothetical protein
LATRTRCHQVRLAEDRVFHQQFEADRQAAQREASRREVERRVEERQAEWRRELELMNVFVFSASAIDPHLEDVALDERLHARASKA